MSDNVVSLPVPERRVWTCACGCRSMNLMADGTISTWTPIDDKRRHQWLKGRLSAAWLLMKPGGPSA